MKEPHELSRLFPVLSETELADLATDIKKHGQREPIMLCDRRVLDGVQRQRACEIAGVKPFYVSFESQPEHITRGGPLAYVVSENLYRRHLTDSVRAAIAADMVNEKRGGDRKSNQSSNLSNGRITQPRAATLMKVSRTQVQTAVRVKREAPELHKAVKSGKVTLNRAARTVAAKHKPTKAQVRRMKEKQDLLRQGLTLKHTIQSLTMRAKRNGGMIYIELGGYGIRCSKICGR